MLKLSGISLGLFVAATLGMTSGANAAAHAAKPIKNAMVGSEKILTDAKGMTLYTFDKDAKGMSNCNGGCAVNWPPLMAKKKGMGKGDLSVIVRKDGSLQWAYKGKPLYTWINDTKTGQMTGNGVNGVWHTAKP